MSQHPPLPDDYFENREVVIKTESEEIQPTPPKRPRLRIASVQHEPEEPQESFDVDVVYTIKQEEMRDARMQESSTVGRNFPQGQEENSLLKMNLVDEGYKPIKVVGMTTVMEKPHYWVKMEGVSTLDYLPVDLMNRDYPQMVADFFKEYKPLEILDMTRVDKVLHYKVKADGRDELDLMPADIMKEKFPQLVDDFIMWRANLVKK